jgi:hypothetical protein
MCCQHKCQYCDFVFFVACTEQRNIDYHTPVESRSRVVCPQTWWYPCDIMAAICHRCAFDRQGVRPQTEVYLGEDSKKPEQRGGSLGRSKHPHTALGQSSHAVATGIPANAGGAFQQPALLQPLLPRPFLPQPSLQQPALQHPAFQQPIVQQPPFQQQAFQQPPSQHPARPITSLGQHCNRTSANSDTIGNGGPVAATSSQEPRNEPQTRPFESGKSDGRQDVHDGGDMLPVTKDEKGVLGAFSTF